MDEISLERVACAAALGHEVALQVANPTDLPARPGPLAEHAARLLGPVEAGRWAADLAELAVAHAWIDATDTRPARAIAAGRAWVACPCQEHMAAADAAAAEAEEAAWATWGPAREAALAAAWAAEAEAGAGAAWAALAAVRSGVLTWAEVCASLAERLLA